MIRKRELCAFITGLLISLVMLVASTYVWDSGQSGETPKTKARHVPLGATLEMFFPIEEILQEHLQEQWYYYLTPEHQDLIERVVMAESGNQSLLGQQAVAQSILNQAQLTGTTPYVVVTKPHQYTAPYSGEVSLQTKEAVYLVFHNGKMAVGDNIQYFYSLATGKTSAWHESKVWVCTIGAHKFFKEG